MNYAIQGTATQLKPGREVSMTRSGEIPMKPGAGMPSIATRTRRHSLSSVRAALSGRRRTGLPDSGSQASAGSGLSPITIGASRGVAILVSR